MSDCAASERGGINVAGYLRTESGVGTAVRRYIRALRTLGVPLTLHDLSPLQGNRSLDATPLRSSGDDRHDVSLVCADVELHYAIMAHLGEDFFQDHHAVGIWAWELPRFPDKWYDRFAFYDEIWVGTSFVANALAPVAPVPIVRVPPVLTVEHQGSRARGRDRLGAPREEFLYLFIFDFHSHMERKSPLATIDAFRAAFAPSDAARLVIKCVNAEADPSGFAALRARAEGHRVDIHTGYWTADEVQDLMAACDAYVSLHRSEGTGLTLSDAMAIGKPVIATGYSGNMDFMTVANSYPVAYELVTIDRGVGPYREGETWAEPSVEHAAELMRRVFTNRDEARARGTIAQRDIERDWSAEAVAELIGTRLDAIRVCRHYPRFREEAWASYREYRCLGDRIRAVVRKTVPPDAIVLVISKGDEDLVRLDGRRGWHYPRAESGAYAGWYPADSADAIAHLEALQAQGADYLLLPWTAFWWLEHYTGLRDHLEQRYRQVARHDDTCLIFALANPRRRSAVPARSEEALTDEC